MPRKDRPPPKYKKVAWVDRYAELCVYRGQHGNCCVPFNWKENPRLGAWVAQQRQSYHRFLRNKPCGLMSPERIRLLEKIDFCWTLSKGSRTPDQKHIVKEWKDYFNELKEYQKTHAGDTRVPQHYKENPSLGRFVNAQRTAYTHYQRNLQQIQDGTSTKTDPFLGTQLTQERFDLLSGIGFVWQHESSRLREMWETRYQELLAFVKEHGHANVPTAKSSLGQWVKKQRQAYFKYMKTANKSETQTRKKGSPTAMNEERIKQLEEAGFQWVPSQPEWLEKYQELVEFQKKHGNCDVPFPTKEEEQGEHVDEEEDDDGDDDVDSFEDKKPAAKKTKPEEKDAKDDKGSGQEATKINRTDSQHVTTVDGKAKDPEAKTSENTKKTPENNDANKKPAATENRDSDKTSNSEGESMDTTADNGDLPQKSIEANPEEDQGANKNPAETDDFKHPVTSPASAAKTQRNENNSKKRVGATKKKKKKSSGQSLFAWVQMQRALYPKFLSQGGKRRPHDLTEDRIKMLTDLGFDWATTVGDSAASDGFKDGEASPTKAASTQDTKKAENKKDTGTMAEGEPTEKEKEETFANTKHGSASKPAAKLAAKDPPQTLRKKTQDKPIKKRSVDIVAAKDAMPASKKVKKESDDVTGPAKPSQQQVVSV